MVFWGLGYLATKVVLQDLGPMQAATLRVLLSAVLFVPLWSAMRREISARTGALLGLTGVIGFYVPYNLGLQTARTTDAAMIHAGIPAMSALLAMPLLGERPRPRVWAGIALSTAGVVALVQGTTAPGGEGSLAGDVWILLSAVAWAVYSILVRRSTRGASPGSVTAATFAWGAVFFLPLALAELAYVTPAPTLGSLAATLYLGAVVGALGYWLYSVGLSRIDAARATTYNNLLPLVAAIAGVMVLGERIGTLELIAGAVIIGGVMLATAPIRR